MAKSQPLYSLEEQYVLLDSLLPDSYSTINIIKLNLLVACSSSGNLDTAKNRFLNLIQDTEIKTLFSSVLEVPEIKITEGVNSIQSIHSKFSGLYSLFYKARAELKSAKLPQPTLNALEEYYEANQDPVYKLSILASMVMFAYLLDDLNNNRKE